MERCRICGRPARRVESRRCHGLDRSTEPVAVQHSFVQKPDEQEGGFVIDIRQAQVAAAGLRKLPILTQPLISPVSCRSGIAF
jgi:hypothetical protein